MNITPDLFLEALYDGNLPEFSFNASSRNEWEQWRPQLVDSLKDLLGIKRLFAGKADLAASILENVKLPGYTRQRVRFGTVENLEMLAYVLIPDIKGKRLPAVVACHGHGYGSREVVGLTPDSLDNSENPGYQKNFALELMKKGFIVIAPDIIGFGDRRLKEDLGKPLNESSCHRLSTYLMMMGLTTAGLRTYETMRTIDYLISRDDVDADRIGCMGISGGGLVCSFTSALDDRIKAAVVSGYANTFIDSIMAMFHCVDNFIPSVLAKAELPDILALIAPRPLLIEAGIHDTIFPIKAVNEIYAILERVYSMLSIREKLDIDIFEGDHRISGAKAYEWLWKQLS